MESASDTEPQAKTVRKRPKRRRKVRLGEGGAGNGGERVSMEDVARVAKVSTATVSKVLNNHPHVSKAMRIHVSRIIEKLDYHPNRLAQGLSSQYTRVLAVLLPHLNHVFADPYFGELISGVFDAARQLDHKIMVEHITADFIKERKPIELFERRFVDGVLCLGLHDQHTFIKDLAERGYPMLSVNNHFPEWGIDYVMCDYRSGADQAMNFLLQLGHRKIGLIAGSRGIQTMRDIVDAFFDHVRDVNPTVDESWIARGRFTEQGGVEAMEKLLTEHDDLTAVFAASDKMALGAMHYLQRRGVHVPGQVSIIGFDDLKQMAFVNPNLTTVNLPYYEVGARSCEALVELIGGRASRIFEKFDTHLVIRESTCAPN